MADEKERQDPSVASDDSIIDEQLDEASGGAVFPGHTKYSTVRLERAAAAGDEPGRSSNEEVPGLGEITDDQLDDASGGTGWDNVKNVAWTDHSIELSRDDDGEDPDKVRKG